LIHGTDIVMYDAWWPHLEDWGLSRLQEIKRQRIRYYVTFLSTVAEKATYLRAEPLTRDEVSIHRPDLPVSLVQCAAMQWPVEVPQVAADLTERWRAAGCSDSRAGIGLNASEIYLYPFGSKGGQKAGVRVRADNGVAFTPEELLWKAAMLQAPHVGDVLPTQGVGFYRTGLHRGIPGYYLWGSESQMHTHIADFERRQSQAELTIDTQRRGS
jgi:hypothetical protein